jgi:hypothetical protein
MTAGDVANDLYCGRFFVIGECECPLAAKKSERAISMKCIWEENQAKGPGKCPGKVSKS